MSILGTFLRSKNVVSVVARSGRNACKRCWSVTPRLAADVAAFWAGCAGLPAGSSGKAQAVIANRCWPGNLLRRAALPLEGRLSGLPAGSGSSSAIRAGGPSRSAPPGLGHPAACPLASAPVFCSALPALRCGGRPPTTVGHYKCRGGAWRAAMARAWCLWLNEAPSNQPSGGPRQCAGRVCDMATTISCR